LVPHAITKHGLDSKEWAIDDEALLTIIRRYTREAGVRNLERELSTLIRKAVKELPLSATKTAKASADNPPEYLGATDGRYGRGQGRDRHGHRARLDRRRRRAAHHRSRHDAGQGPDDGDRQPARCDEGIDLGRGVLRAHARGCLRHQAALV